MEPVNLFDLAAQQSRWLAVRQSAVAGNIANVNTPGYGAVDVEPFEKVLDNTGVAMAATQAGHLSGRRDGGRLLDPPGRAQRLGAAVRKLRRAGERADEGRRRPPAVRAQHGHRQSVSPHDHAELEGLTMDALATALKVAASGLGAQSERLRVVSENLANAQSTGDTRGRRSLSPQDHQLRRRTRPRQRRLAGRGQRDRPRRHREFPVEFLPGHEAADEKGYVKMPNVNVLIEMADMSEANRSYEANLQVIKQARELISMTIDLMRGQ